MRKFLTCTLALSLVGLTSLFVSRPTQADDQSKWNDRIENSGVVVKEILNVPDDIPQDLIDKADCVIVYPSVLKAAFGIGASYGRGLMTCRSGEDFRGHWSAPSMMALEGGSIGFQLGAQATDFVLLVMNERGASSILSAKVKLGGDASAAAGPKGRDLSAATDVTMRAEILTYSRARGLFAGISLEGSTVRPDNDGNEAVYGKKLSAHDIVLKDVVAPPASAKMLIAELTRHSPRYSNRTK
jgi:lipid-binding SYLF domain-containing protein